MNIVIVGHVDHGKSTIIGRLLADTNSLPEGKLQQIKDYCARNSKPFEYAFLIDALKDEQSQGITIDSARVFFKTAKRPYIIIDAPGHIEFLKNMVTGASRAEAALLVIDAEEGIRENTRRHSYMLAMLGITQVAVLINKMDLVGYSKSVFDSIVAEYRVFLNDIGIRPDHFIPVSGMYGDGIAGAGENMPWYRDHTVLEVLDMFIKEQAPLDQSLRMPVQDVYKFTSSKDTRRIVAGTIETGRIKPGDDIVFYPSGKRSRVSSIEYFNGQMLDGAVAGQPVGFTLAEQIYVTRGEVAARATEPHPMVTTRLRANIFWLGKSPFEKGKEYLLKLGTAKVPMKLEEVRRVINASDLNVTEDKEMVERNEVAECLLKCSRAIAFDLAGECASTSRFVIVDNYEITGGGIVTESMQDRQTKVRDKVLTKNYRWEKSIISYEQRAEKYSQRASLVLVTGQKDSGKKPIAKGLEAKLFNDGKIVYFLGIGNLRYGIAADLLESGNSHEEQIRRMSEVASMFLEAGFILIVTAVEINNDDLDILKTVLPPERLLAVWVGDSSHADISYDLHLPGHHDLEESVERIKSSLQERGIIFKP